MIRQNIRQIVLALALGFPEIALATDIQVGFDQPGAPIPLRLNNGSNGWTHPGWSQYFDDIGVQYRRMDHWNSDYNPIRRRPDGGLWYDYGALDTAIYKATGGYSFKAYPTIDFSAACFDTDFLQNPFAFLPASAQGYLTPAGTLVISGKESTSNPALAELSMGVPTATALYEIDRQGVVVGQYPYQEISFVTSTNHVALKTADGYSLLGPDRKEIAHGTGQLLQEIDGTSLLVGSGPQDSSRKLTQVDFKGTVLQSFPGTFGGPVLMTKSGLLSFDNEELTLIGKNGKQSIQKFTDPTIAGFIAANPQDPQGRFFLVAGSRANCTVYAFSSDGQQLWKTDPIVVEDRRGLEATRDGVLILGCADRLLGIDRSGIIWKTSDRGSLDLQLLSTPFMETAIVRTYEDEIDEYDVHTGEPLWRYGLNGDAAYWTCAPPKDLVGWQDSVSKYLKHFNKDLGLGWDRWELWNEPTEHGYFWQGTWQDYAAMLNVTMKAVEAEDPSITMDAYDGSGWWTNLINYCNENKVRLDSISWHGYLVGDGNYDAFEQNALDEHNISFKAYTGPNKLQLSNTEWNVHPGQGEDLSHNYKTGYYHAPFQAEMTYLMGKGGVKFSSEFAMLGNFMWPCGWIYTSDKPVGGQAPKAGTVLRFFTPAYNGVRLWAMLPLDEAPVTSNFTPQVVAGTAAQVHAVAGSDPAKGEYGLLVWNYSNQSTAAKDEDVNLTLNFKGESQLHMRHFIIDQDHSTYTRDWQHQWLEAAESKQDSAAGFQKQTVTLKKDSLHAFFFTREAMKANAGKNITVEAHHPVHFDGSASTGMPAFYRWDVDSSDGVDFPDPNDGPPSRSHLYGMKPNLVMGYDKPGTYTVTLQVSADGYHKVTDTSTVTVTVLPEKTAPESPQNLAANCAKTDHQVFLQWDSLNFARNPDVAAFVIYRKQGTDDWKKVASQAVSTSFVDSGVAEKVPYMYRVTAIDSSGNESAPSNEAKAVFQINHQPPKSPVSLKATIVNDDLVRLDWNNDNLIDAACVKRFNVYRRVAGSGDWQKLSDRPTWYKRYYDALSNSGMADHYEYCVTALDAFKNESLQSDTATPAAK